MRRDLDPIGSLHDKKNSRASHHHAAYSNQILQIEQVKRLSYSFEIFLKTVPF